MHVPDGFAWLDFGLIGAIRITADRQGVNRSEKNLKIHCHNAYRSEIKYTLSQCLFFLSLLSLKSFLVGRQYSEPTSQDAKPRVQPGVRPPFYIPNVAGEPRVKPGSWRPEM
jgi:hypothetical protein